MKKSIAILVILIGVLTTCYLKQTDHPFRKYEHELAVCAIFKNEAPYLKEWIDYHHDILGATRFYLYNNDSSDHYQEVLQPYIETGLVELIEWNSIDAHAIDVPKICNFPWDRYQIGAYTDCMKRRALGKVRWVAVHDIDEFLVPPKGVETFYQILKDVSRPNLKKFLKNPFKGTRPIGCLKAHWLIFGTSHVWDIEEGELITERLTLRAPDDFHWHVNTKCLYRPEAVNTCLIHNAYLKKESYRSKYLSLEECRVHHYYTGPEKRLLDKRKPTPERLAELAPLNSIEDHTLKDLRAQSAQ